MNIEKKIISDLKKLGIEVIKSPMNYYTVKVKKYDKLGLVKEVQEMLLNNNYSLMSAKVIGDFMKKNMETNREWLKKNRGKPSPLTGQGGKGK